MDWITKSDAINILNGYDDNVPICLYCFSALVQTEEGTYYCPNEMCLYLYDEQEELDEA